MIDKIIYLVVLSMIADLNKFLIIADSITAAAAAADDDDDDDDDDADADDADNDGKGIIN